MQVADDVAGFVGMLFRQRGLIDAIDGVGVQQFVEHHSDKQRPGPRRRRLGSNSVRIPPDGKTSPRLRPAVSRGLVPRFRENQK